MNNTVELLTSYGVQAKAFVQIWLKDSVKPAV